MRIFIRREDHLVRKWLDFDTIRLVGWLVRLGFLRGGDPPYGQIVRGSTEAALNKQSINMTVSNNLFIYFIYSFIVFTAPRQNAFPQSSSEPINVFGVDFIVEVCAQLSVRPNPVVA